MKTINNRRENFLIGLTVLSLGTMTILITAQNLKNTAKSDLNKNAAYIITLSNNDIKIIDPSSSEIIFIDNFDSKSGLSEAILKDNE